jgi:WD40 repeat protein
MRTSVVGAVLSVALLSPPLADASLEDDAATTKHRVTEGSMPSTIEGAITRDNLDTLAQVASTQVIDPHYVVWSKDGSRLYIASAEAVFEFIVDGSSLRMLISISPGETVLSLGSNGVVALMTDSGTVFLHDLHSGQKRPVPQTDFPVSSASFSPNGQILVLILDNGSLLRTFSVPTGDGLAEFRSPDPTEPAYSAEFAPSGESLVWLSPTAGRGLDLASGGFGVRLGFASSLVDAAVSPSTQLLAATSDQGISLFEPSNGALIDSESGMSGYSLSYSGDGALLLMTGDSTVQIADATSLTILRSLPLQALDATFSPSGDALAVVSADGVISVWSPSADARHALTHTHRLGIIVADRDPSD